MKKQTRAFVFVAAILGMGISMPSCPGQQAMQQQIDTLQTANTDLTKKVQSYDAQIKQLNKDSAEVKANLDGAVKAIEAQKAALEALNTAVTEIKAKAAAPAPAAKKAPAKKRR